MKMMWFAKIANVLKMNFVFLFERIDYLKALVGGVICLPVASLLHRAV